LSSGLDISKDYLIESRIQMYISLLKKLKNKRDGLTLIEVILSLAILGIIIISFLNMFVFSTVTNSKSEDIMDATYIAQGRIEKRFGESKDRTVPIPLDIGKIYSGSIEGYWIEEEILNIDDNLVRLIVKVYSDESKNKLEAQMETYLLWDSN
jgi:prepilin-type N-terminal cleavage/methylation domain-containing protein